MSDTDKATHVSFEGNNLPNAPQPDWLPPGQASFYFLPEYTGRGPEWIKAVSTFAERSLRTAEIEWELVPDDDERFLVRSDGLEFGVYADLGIFSLGASSSDFQPAFVGEFELVSTPRDFLAAYNKLEIIPKFSRAGEAFRYLASTL